jgi:prepilin-type processing-associated H-X9-DG protein
MLLLIPAAQTVRRKAQQATDTSQLHQIYIGLMLHENELRSIPQAFSSSTGIWFGEDAPVRPYLGEPDEVLRLVIPPLSYAPPGVSLNPYGFPYVVNYKVMPYYDLQTEIFSLNEIQNPDQIILMTNGVTNGSWYVGFRSAESNGGWARVSPLYDGKLNVLWTDGHVSAEAKKNLTNENVFPNR